MAEENITTSKVVYGAKSANEFIDNSFSELFKTKDPININRFFSMYDDLFYNIPKLGDKSHTTLINKSRNYVLNYIDPLQLEVDNLTEENIRLTEQLNESTEEHPFYSNGTLLSKPSDDGTPHGYIIYYMDWGLARHVIGDTDDDTFIALKASLGYPSNTNYKDIILAVPQSIIDGLNKGPKLGIEDIAYPLAEDEEQRLAANLAQQNQISISSITDNSWWDTYFNSGVGQVNRDNFITNGFPIVRNAIRIAWNEERSIETLRNKYLADINYGYTIEEQENGQILLDQLLGNNGTQSSYNKLNASRDTLVRYKRIWEILRGGSSSFITNIKIAVNTDISNSERNEFEGKWKDMHFYEIFPPMDSNSIGHFQSTPPPINPGPPGMGQGQ